MTQILPAQSFVHPTSPATVNVKNFAALQLLHQKIFSTVEMRNYDLKKSTALILCECSRSCR